MKLRSLSRLSRRASGVIVPMLAALFMSAAVVGCSSTDGAAEPEAALEESADGGAAAPSETPKDENASAVSAENGAAAAQPTGEQANAAASNELQSLMNDSGAANQPLPTDGANGALNAGNAGTDPFNANAAPAAAPANEGVAVTQNPSAAPVESAPPAVPTQDPFAASGEQASPAVADAPAAEPTSAAAHKETSSASASQPSVGVLPENGTKMPYHIQKGDTLASISSKIYGNGSRWKELARENNIHDASLIYAGDVILYTLNDKSRSFAEHYESASRKKIVVERGDTLSKISSKVYGTESHWRSIWKDNPQIKNPDIIKPGMVLLVREASGSVAEAHRVQGSEEVASKQETQAQSVEEQQ